MTQAYNLSQLGNHVNTAGLLDVSVGVTGTQAIANGGTGGSTQQTALNNLAGAVTNNYALIGNGTNVSMQPITASAITGTLGVANGGTGATSLTANNVILGNGTSAVQLVAPSTSGNVLTSNGTTWQSTTPNFDSYVSLGTITFSGTGSQFSLTGLTLTPYKQLYMVLSNVLIANAQSFSVSNTTGNQVANNGFTTGTTTQYYSGNLTIDLNTGLISAVFGDKTNSNVLVRNTTALTLPIPLGTSLSYTNYNFGTTALGTASSIVYVFITGTATKSGTITIYGVR